MELSVVLVVVLQVLVGAVLAFTPTGKHDLGPADLKALCPMIKEFEKPENDKLKIKTRKIAAGGEDGDDCIYFKWNECPSGIGNETKPCGWYEMTKCGAARRRRSPKLLDLPEIDERPSKFIPELSFQNFEHTL